MFQPIYTMLGHNWLDVRGAEGIGYVKAVGSHLPHQLREIMPQMYSNIQSSFDEQYLRAHDYRGDIESVLADVTLLIL